MKKAARALPGNEAASHQLPQQADHTSPGPFGQWALQFVQAGLLPIPITADGNKVPAIAWSTATRKQAIALSHQPKFAAANIGLILGKPSGITVIDIDTQDPLVLMQMKHRFGDTPIVIRTASGKFHLWYRYDGECRHIKIFGKSGPPVDLLGARGYCLAPPSAIPGQGTYEFMAGSLADVASLPKIRPGVVDAIIRERNATPSSCSKAPSPRQPAAQPTTSTPAADGKIHEGQRDDSIFKQGLQIARDVHRRRGDQAEVLAELTTFNRDNCEPPLEQAIIVEKAAHVWKMTLDGENYVDQGDPWHVLSKLVRGGAHSDDVALHIVLKNAHRGRDNFALVPEAMEESQVIPGWPEARYRRSIRRQEENEWLECIHRGGRGPKDPSLYRFCAKGTKSVPNLNLHLPPASSLGSSESFQSDLLGEPIFEFMEAVEFGQVVRRRRLERGMTAGQLAAIVGLKRPTLSNIEGGRYPTTQDRQRAILAALEAKADEVAA